MTDADQCSDYNQLLRSISLKEAYEFIMPSLKADDNHLSNADLWYFVPYCKVNGRYIGEKVPGYKVSTVCPVEPQKLLALLATLLPALNIVRSYKPKMVNAPELLNQVIVKGGFE